MPVLVTAADTALGSRVVRRLLREGGEVRAYGGGGAEGLRGAGAIVANGDLDDEGRLEAAMAQVHTVIHLTGGLLSRAIVRAVAEAETVVTAAANAGVRRLILLSLPGASPEAGDHLRRAKARVEAVAERAAVPTVVLRTSLVDTPALRDALASMRPGPELLDTPVAPLRSEDLIELLVAFDSARSQAQRGHAVFAADGPQRMRLTDYLERVGVGGPEAVGTLVGRVWRPADTVPLLAPALPGPWVARDDRIGGDPLPDAWSLADLTPAPIRSVPPGGADGVPSIA